MRTALFAPCFVDQVYPRAAIAALQLLERVGVAVEVPAGAACCGQPPANAGYERAGDAALSRFAEVFAPYDRIVVLSGSCALHLRQHAEAAGRGGQSVAAATCEFTSFLHDDVGIERLRAVQGVDARSIAVHIGCHALRGLGLAKPSELQQPPFDKVRAVLGTVRGVSFAPLRRADECCGFGGTFSVDEPSVSAKMAADRLGDFSTSGADVVVSTDVSCMLHLAGVGRARNGGVPFLHVAEFLAGALP